MKYMLATAHKPLSDYTWRDFSIRKVNAKQAAFITFASHQDADAFGSRLRSNAIAVRFSDEELEISADLFASEKPTWRRIATNVFTVARCAKRKDLYKTESEIKPEPNNAMEPTPVNVTIRAFARLAPFSRIRDKQSCWL